MAIITVKGHEFKVSVGKDSFHRRAQAFQNAIIRALGKLGISEDQIDVPLEVFGLKKAPASATWYMEGYHLYYSYNGSPTFVENLSVVSQVIELEVRALLQEEKTAEEFIRDFSEDTDVESQRKEAREILGVDSDTLDMDSINKKYKELAKKYHPDMPGGNPEKFKAINHAHKTLKRELE